MKWRYYTSAVIYGANCHLLPQIECFDNLEAVWSNSIWPRFDLLAHGVASFSRLITRATSCHEVPHFAYSSAGVLAGKDGSSENSGEENTRSSGVSPKWPFKCTHDSCTRSFTEVQCEYVYACRVWMVYVLIMYEFVFWCINIFCMCVHLWMPACSLFLMS